MGWQTIEIVDPDRATDAIVDSEGTELLAASDTRTMNTVLMYPATGDGGENAGVADTEPRPLVLWLNGLGGFASPDDPLLINLVEAGYIVASPDIAEVSDPVADASGFARQPDDALFVIDAVVSPDDGVADELAPVVDEERIGLAGQSIGAAGILALGFHDCCRDDRVDAVVAYGAEPAYEFEGQDYEFTGTPLLLIYGTEDEISPVANGEAILAAADSPAYLLTTDDGDHFEPAYGDPLSVPSARTATDATIAFFDRYLAEDSTDADFQETIDGLTASTWTSAET